MDTTKEPYWNEVWAFSNPDLHKTEKVTMIEQEAGYIVWNGMMGRCYRPTTPAAKKTYEGCYVCDEWHTFKTFQKWYVENYRLGCELDKDLAIENNKCYSPDTCYFVPSGLNVLIMPNATGYTKKRERFAARVKRGNKQYNLGTFDTAEEARAEYLKHKLIVIRLELPKYKGRVDDTLFNILTKRYRK